MKALQKYGLFTLIYLILTWALSNDMSCVLDLDGYCLANLLGKYALFMILMVVYDRWIKDKIFKKEKQNK